MYRIYIHLEGEVNPHTGTTKPPEVGTRKFYLHLACVFNLGKPPLEVRDGSVFGDETRGALSHDGLGTVAWNLGGGGQSSDPCWKWSLPSGARSALFFAH